MCEGSRNVLVYVQHSITLHQVDCVNSPAALFHRCCFLGLLGPALVAAAPASAPPGIGCMLPSGWPGASAAGCSKATAQQRLTFSFSIYISMLDHSCQQQSCTIHAYTPQHRLMHADAPLLHYHGKYGCNIALTAISSSNDVNSSRLLTTDKPACPYAKQVSHGAEI
jgi:hypothetical protein